MKKVKVSICMGTACYVLGGADILNHVGNLKSKYGRAIECEGVPCLGQCKSGVQRKAPFAQVNDILIERANIELIDAAIASALKER